MRSNWPSKIQRLAPPPAKQRCYCLADFLQGTFRSLQPPCSIPSQLILNHQPSTSASSTAAAFPNTDPSSTSSAFNRHPVLQHKQRLAAGQTGYANAIHTSTPAVLSTHSSVRCFQFSHRHLRSCPAVLQAHSSPAAEAPAAAGSLLYKQTACMCAWQCM